MGKKAEQRLMGMAYRSPRLSSGVKGVNSLGVVFADCAMEPRRLRHVKERSAGGQHVSLGGQRGGSVPDEKDTDYQQ